MTDSPRLGLARVAFLIIGTSLVIALLGHFDLSDLATRHLTGDGERTRIQPSRYDATECDIQFGKNLLETQRQLPTAGGRQRIVFFGNSQQYTASLPRGATPDEANLAEMASALFARRLEREQPERYQVYAAAAPNQTFPEALWQALYWFEVRPDKPTVIVLQASFDTFRKSGIRVGFRTLLDEPAYRDALDRYGAANRNRAWHSEFEKAEQPAETETLAGDKARPWLETELRRLLEHVPLYARRKDYKASFLLGLYSARVLALGISPTTKRHIIGQTFSSNWEALEDLVALARRHGARVFVYNAPTNPKVSMFYEDEYRDYIARLESLARSGDIVFADLGSAVSEGNWGFWVDGPDPIHFDREGHVELADALFAAFGGRISEP